MSSGNLIRLIPMLEKVSALSIANNQSLINKLEDSIRYASRLETVDIDGVDPLYHLDEGGRLFLQEDKVEPQDKLSVLANAGEKIEDYFVSPVSMSFRDKSIDTKSGGDMENQI